MDETLTFAIIKLTMNKMSLDPDMLTNYIPISQFPINNILLIYTDHKIIIIRLNEEL